MRRSLKVLMCVSGLLSLVILFLTLGIVLTPQKAPHLMEQKLVLFSGPSARASFMCPDGKMFNFLISFSDDQIVTNFNGKIRIFCNDKLVVQRQIVKLVSGDLLEYKNVRNVFSMIPDPSDGHGLTWDCLLVTNQTYIVDFECTENLVEATLFYSYVFFDYVKGARTR